MRDYLKHIAARVAGTRSVVRPRIQSLFEPSKELASLRLPLVTLEHHEPYREPGLGAIEEGRPLVPASGKSLRETGTPKNSFRATGDEPSTNKTEQLEVGIVSRRTNDDEKSGRVQSEQPSRTIPESAPQKASIEPVESRVVIRPAVRAVTLTENREQSSRPKPSLPEQSKSQLQPAVDEVATIEHRVPLVHQKTDASDGVRPRSEPNSALPLAPSGSSISRPTPVAVAGRPVLLQDRTGERTQEKAIQDQPSVQVVIGRVIVEATTPSAAQSPRPVRPMPSPQLSLDDYLRQRGGRT